MLEEHVDELPEDVVGGLDQLLADQRVGCRRVELPLGAQRREGHRERPDGAGVTPGPARRLHTRLTSLSAVDWYGENTLVLAGAVGRPAVYEVSVDGARESRLEDKIGARVTHLAAYPANAVGRLGAAMYEANGVAYRSGPFERIQPEQVQEVTPPSAGARAGNPTAPFFLY